MGFNSELKGLTAIELTKGGSSTFTQKQYIGQNN
jgi:hypothetical protein